MKKLTIQALILAGTVLFLGSNYTLGQTDTSSGGTSASATSSAKKSQSWFDDVDTNNDGKISHEEYMGYTKSRFQSADANGDGFLTKDEVGEGKGRGKGKKTKKGGSFGAY